MLRLNETRWSPFNSESRRRITDFVSLTSTRCSSSKCATSRLPTQSAGPAANAPSPTAVPSASSQHRSMNSSCRSITSRSSSSSTGPVRPPQCASSAARKSEVLYGPTVRASRLRCDRDRRVVGLRSIVARLDAAANDARPDHRNIYSSALLHALRRRVVCRCWQEDRTPELFADGKVDGAPSARRHRHGDGIPPSADQPELVGPLGEWRLCVAGQRAGGDDGNRTHVQGFAGPCLNHSATSPGTGSPVERERRYLAGARSSLCVSAQNDCRSVR